MGFDNDNNIYLTDEFSHRVVRFKLPYTTSISQDKRQITIPQLDAFIINDKPGMITPNEVGPYKMDMTNGLITTHNQLIVRDRHRFLVWPDYVDAGYQDNFVVGQANPYTNTSDPQRIGRAAGFAVTQDKLWSFNSHG